MELMEVMHSKLGAKSVEFGYLVDGPDPDRDPDPDEEITWWAKAQHRGGPVWIAERRALASDPTGAIEVLADLCRKMGGKVRIRVAGGPSRGPAEITD